MLIMAGLRSCGMQAGGITCRNLLPQMVQSVSGNPGANDVGQVISVPVNCSSWRYKQPILIYFVRFELSRSLFDPLFSRVGLKHFSDNLLKVGTVSFERETTFYQHSTLQIFAVP